VFSRAPRERRVAGRQKHKMIEIRACQAQGALIFNERNPGPPTKVFATIIAGGIPG
jgi:hypothetical protein